MDIPINIKNKTTTKTPQILHFKNKVIRVLSADLNV
jgi:hypothetical protein